ncbi:MAG: YbhB/YbcL family Raf kinase inhibitor-like protein [Nanoarchaeota archaeon]|nr:YbhB/YbcL family Raf kinase inhibitor-like protein [Nanoarchaeota archaeon]MBU1644113.1 YbhB/YbcL family Raf kinase inhibitor-like protein [Nanoarchaeota archaeon]MBU1976448.1 YbhB/YbcL family Raf kinase inhibitor-like protein [Nanoarchaeota archaeon]
MEILSSAFDDGDEIPIKYTCDDEDISPPLEFSDIPEEAKSLVLILDDPDAPKETWTHWLVFNIPVNATEVDEGKEPKGTAGENSWGKLGYGGPCPPDGEHKYIFKLFALDLKLDLPEGSNKNDVEAAMEGHILEKAELIGKYERK